MASAEEKLNRLVNHEISLGGLSKNQLDDAFGVERFARLLSYLGDPQKDFVAIQIAGTNGKGTTAFYLSEFLRRYSLRVGSFFSPHLLSVHERLRLDGSPISEENLFRFLSDIDSVVSRHDLSITYFEALTAAAFLWFARSRVHVAVLETGLGGRLDSVTHARAGIGIITNIALDHQRLLGHTPKEILGEKAGILHSGMKLVHGRLSYPLRQELQKYLHKEQTVFALGEDFGYTRANIHEQQKNHLLMDLGPIAPYNLDLFLRPNFPKFLLDNMALAFFGACLFLEDSGRSSQQQSLSGIVQEVAHLDFDGRWHKLGSYNDPRGPVPFYFDGGHNPSAILRLMPELRRIARDHSLVIFLAAFRDKGVRRMLALLNKVAQNIHLWRPRDESSRWFNPADTAHALARRLSSRRGLELQEILSWSSDQGYDEAQLADEVEQILRRTSSKLPPAVVFVGSLASYAWVRQALRRIIKP